MKTFGASQLAGKMALQCLQVLTCLFSFVEAPVWLLAAIRPMQWY